MSSSPNQPSGALVERKVRVPREIAEILREYPREERSTVRRHLVKMGLKLLMDKAKDEADSEFVSRRGAGGDGREVELQTPRHVVTERTRGGDARHHGHPHHHQQHHHHQAAVRGTASRQKTRSGPPAELMDAPAVHLDAVVHDADPLAPGLDAEHVALGPSISENALLDGLAGSSETTTTDREASSSALALTTTTTAGSRRPPRHRRRERELPARLAGEGSEATPPMGPVRSQRARQPPVAWFCSFGDDGAPATTAMIPAARSRSEEQRDRRAAGSVAMERLSAEQTQHEEPQHHRHPRSPKPAPSDQQHHQHQPQEADGAPCTTADHSPQHRQVHHPHHGHSSHHHTGGGVSPRPHRQQRAANEQERQQQLQQHLTVVGRSPNRRQRGSRRGTPSKRERVQTGPLTAFLDEQRALRRSGVGSSDTDEVRLPKTILEATSRRDTLVFAEDGGDQMLGGGPSAEYNAACRVAVSDSSSSTNKQQAALLPAPVQLATSPGGRAGQSMSASSSPLVPTPVRAAAGEHKSQTSRAPAVPSTTSANPPPPGGHDLLTPSASNERVVDNGASSATNSVSLRAECATAPPLSSPETALTPNPGPPGGGSTTTATADGTTASSSGPGQGPLSATNHSSDPAARKRTPPPAQNTSDSSPLSQHIVVPPARAVPVPGGGEDRYASGSGGSGGARPAGGAAFVVGSRVGGVRVSPQRGGRYAHGSPARGVVYDDSASTIQIHSGRRSVTPTPMMRRAFPALSAVFAHAGLMPAAGSASANSSTSGQSLVFWSVNTVPSSPAEASSERAALIAAQQRGLQPPRAVSPVGGELRVAIQRAVAEMAGQRVSRMQLAAALRVDPNSRTAQSDAFAELYRQALVEYHQNTAWGAV